MSEPKQIFVKPAKGAKIRFADPARGFIPEGGVSIAPSTYIRRRIRDGDLEVRRPKPAKSESDKKD